MAELQKVELTQSPGVTFLGSHELRRHRIQETFDALREYETLFAHPCRRSGKSFLTLPPNLSDFEKLIREENRGQFLSVTVRNLNASCACSRA